MKKKLTKKPKKKRLAKRSAKRKPPLSKQSTIAAQPPGLVRIRQPIPSMAFGASADRLVRYTSPWCVHGAYRGWCSENNCPHWGIPAPPLEIIPYATEDDEDD